MKIIVNSLKQSEPVIFLSTDLPVFYFKELTKRHALDLKKERELVSWIDLVSEGSFFENQLSLSLEDLTSISIALHELLEKNHYKTLKPLHARKSSLIHCQAFS